MKAKYSPQNYSQLQPEQRDTLEQIVRDRKLDINDYIVSIPLSKEVHQELKTSVNKDRDKTRSKIADRLMTIFASSVVATFVLIGVISLTPNSDKELVKVLTPLILTSQGTMLGVALTFYFDKD